MNTVDCAVCGKFIKDGEERTTYNKEEISVCGSCLRKQIQVFTLDNNDDLYVHFAPEFLVHDKDNLIKALNELNLGEGCSIIRQLVTYEQYFDNCVFVKLNN